jgi:hypothetical protein
MGVVDWKKYDVKEIVNEGKECTLKKITACKTKKEKALCHITMEYFQCKTVRARTATCSDRS